MGSTIAIVVFFLLAIALGIQAHRLKKTEAAGGHSHPSDLGEAEANTELSGTRYGRRSENRDIADDELPHEISEGPDESTTRVKVGSVRRRAAPAPPAKVLKPSRLFTIGSWISALIGLVVLAVSCVVTVPTKEIGVVTTFGRPTGSLSNGLHLKAPWQKITYMDAAIQTDSHTADNRQCINVRIAHQATACVDASIRWRIRPQASDALFQNYREFSSIRSSLVDRQLSSSLNREFASYDALAVDDKGNPTAPSLAALSEAATKHMREQIGDQIEVLSVIIPVIKLDENTQSKANALLAQVAQTRIAEQAVKTSEQQAKANKALAQSVSNDPNVLVSKCLDMVESGKVTLPAGFSCWPSSGSSVVVPSASGASK